MQQTFYFYDLETSGVIPKTSRVLQFAGQRTDMQLKPVSPPDNIFIRLSEDILPEPDAILINGITPQKTRTDGISEAEFLRYFQKNISLPGTIFTGFNSIRFDDEFMRYMHYRNFYDPYEWSWKDGRSRWDILDVVRMTRALRPEGIEWPVDSSGKPTNRLEYLTRLNKLEHEDAHDALSDVNATIAVARMIYNKQPKLFNFLLEYRDKKKIAELAANGQSFVYSSGKYPSLYHKTTVVTVLGPHPGKQGVLVYDLRTDPEILKAMIPAEMAKVWMERVEDETKRFPVKTLQFNRCPAVAPLSVLDKASRERISIDPSIITNHKNALTKHPDLYERLLSALTIMDKQQQGKFLVDEQDVDCQLYEGFFDERDKTGMSVVRAAEAEEVNSLDMQFTDERLNKLLPLYKARNFPDSMTHDERISWEAFRYHKLMGGGAKSLASHYFMRLSELAKRQRLSSEQQYLLEELQLYGESILPEPDL
ncbi:exodeoxyribonuclease I [Candidatus Saccharibacteria bacterium]|nr:exodeoxyribonuclease I [Candidatus Saccharibacteria bacterium]